MTNTNNFSANTNPFGDRVLGDAITPNIVEEDTALGLDTTSESAFSNPLKQQLEPISIVSATYELLDESEIENVEIFTGSTSAETIFVQPEPLEGDADNNRHLNFDDVRAIFADRNTDAIADNDVKDLDRDGKITVLDGRKLVVIIKGNQDKTAPNLDFELNNDTASGDSNNNDLITFDPTIVGAIEDFSQVTSLSARFDGTAPENSTEVVSVLDEDGSFVLNRTQLEAINGSSLSDGEYTLYLQAKDKWGNQTEQVSLNFILDTAAPQVDVSDLINNPQIDADSQLTGSVDEELASLSYSFAGQDAVEVAVDGLNFGQSFDLTGLEEGTNSLTITAVDLAGNITTQTLDVEISLGVNDTTPPEIEAALVNDTGSSAEDLITSDPSITGIINDESEIASFSASFNDSFADITSTLQDNGSFSLSQEILEEINGNNSLEDGDYTLNLVAIDEAENESTTSVSFTLDTSEPLLSAGLSVDSGFNDEDNLTNNPQVTGRVNDANSISSLSASLGNVNANIIEFVTEDGSFILDKDTLAIINDGNALTDGEYTLNLAATDLAGNESVTTVSFTLDTTAPELAISEPVANSNLADNNLLTGTVDEEVASLVYQFNNEEVALELSNGEFTQELDLTGLADGNYTLTLIATDKAGNVTESTITVNLDTTPDDVTAPIVDLGLLTDTGSNSEDGITNNPTISGTITDESAIASISASLGDANIDLSDLVDTDGNFTLNETKLAEINGSALADGNYTLNIIAADEFGNESTSNISFTLDTSEPLLSVDLSIDSGFDGEDNFTNNPQIAGTVTDVQIASISASLGDRNIDLSDLVDADGNFTLNQTKLAEINGSALVDGEYILNLTATDVAGNESTTNISFTLDTTAPDLAISEPVANSNLADNNLLTGTVDEDVASLVYQFNNEEVALELSNGEFTQELDLTGLADGNYTLTLIATDKAGNVTESTITVNLDTTPDDVTAPVINAGLVSDTGSSGIDGITFNSEIFGAIADESEITTLVASLDGVNFIDVSDLLTNNGGNFSLDNDALAIINNGNALADGEYNLELIATDAVGNESDLTTVNFVLDTIAPELIINEPAEASLLTIGSELSGTVDEELSIFSYHFNDGEDIDIELTDDGSFVQTFDLTGLPEGENELTITAIDKAGNESEESFIVQVAFSTIELGQTVSDTISATDTSDVFILNAEVGQRIYFDGLDNDNDFNTFVRLISPSGQVIVSFQSTESDRTPITLTEAGAYQVQVRGSVTETEAYSFRILDVDAATELTLGEVKAGTLTDGKSTELFSFTAEAGQQFFLDGQGETFNGTYTIYNAANGFETSQTFGFDREFTLDEAGTYILAVAGNNNEAAQDYRFNLIASEINTQFLTLGEIVTDEIEAVGEEDIYIFSGSVGQRIYFDGIDGDTRIDASLVSPSGINIFSSQNVNGDRTPVTLVEDGVYRLKVDSNSGTTGDYSFQVLDLANAIELTLGEVISNTFDNANSTDLFGFTAEAGQRFFLDGQGNRFNGTYTIYNVANGQILNQNFGSDREFTIANAGTYILAARGSSDTDLTYSFNLIPQDSTTETLVFGETITGEIAPAGDEDLYSFTGSVGQRIYFDGLTNDAGSSAYLISPSGQRTSLTSTANDSTPRTLDEAGTYQIQIDNSGDTTGAYSFRLLDLASASALTLGDVTTGTLNDANSTDLFSFTAEAGQKLFLDGQGTTFNGTYTIYNAANQSIVSQTFGRDDEFTVANAGTYILAARGSSDTDLSYSFNLIPQDSTTETLVFGETITGEIAPAGDEDLYSFTGSVGQRIYFDGLTNDASSSAYLISPSGQRTSLTSTQSDSTPRTLDEAGTYQIQIDNSGDTTGEYSFRVLDSNNAPLIELTDNVGGDLAARTTEVYRFAAQAGQTIELDGTGVSGATYTIYDSANQSLGSVSSNSSREFEIATDGTYFVYARNNNDSAIDGYEFNLTQTAFEEPNPIVGTPLTFGTVVSEAISVADEEDIYTFEGAVGQTVYFDGISSSSSIFADLISPSGQSTSLSHLSNDSLITLTEAGTYQIEIDGFRTTTGDYSFRLLDAADATAITPDTEISSTLPIANTSNLFSFEAQAGDRFYLDELSDPDSDVRYTIYNSANRTVTSTSSDVEFTVDNTGTYLLVAQGNSSAVADYSFSFNLITPETTTQELTLGNIVSSNISEPGEEDIYTFTGSVGETVYFDGISTTPTIYTRLISPSGQNLFNYDFYSVDNDRAPVTLTEAGTYQIEIDGNAETTGDYSFRLLDGADATAITPDTEISSTLPIANTSNLFTFNAQAGDRFYFDELSDPDSDVRYTIYNSADRSVTGSSSDFEFTIDNTGTYLLVAQGNSSAVADYSFSFNLITPEINDRELTLGNIVSSNISEPGEEDIYTFEGAVGQTVYFDGISSDSSRIYTRLISPSGQNIFNFDFYRVDNDRPPVTLTEAGTYQIEIDGNGETTGDYSFRLLDGADATAITPDTEISSTLATSNTSNLFTFEAQAGDRFYFDELSDPDSDVRYDIYNSADRSVTGSSSDFEFTVDNSGTYLLVAQGNSSAVADYSFSFNLITPEINTQELTLGNIVSSSIGEPGEEDIYTFEGAVGQTVYFDGISGSSSIDAYLTSPSGQNIFSFQNVNNDDDSPVTLTEAGTYQVKIDGSGITTGDYSFRMLDTASATELVIDTPTTGTLDASLGTNLYRFNVAEDGQRFYFDELSDPNNDVYFTIYNSGNQVVTGSSSDLEFILDNAGTYLIAAEGYSGQTVGHEFSFNLVTPETTTQELTLGDIVSSNIGEPGEEDIYTFEGAVGQTIYFDGIDGNSSIDVRLVSPSGNNVFSFQNVNGDLAPVTLAEAGIYQLEVDAVTETIGDYQFRVFDVEQAPLLDFDTSITGSLAARNSQVFKFEGTSGQTLSFSELGSTSGGIYRIYDDANQLILNRGFSGSPTDFTLDLPSNGTYTLVLISSSDNVLNYNFQVS